MVSHFSILCTIAIVGVLFDEQLETLFYNYQTVAIMLILFGVAFIVIENYHKGKKAKVNTLVGIDYKLAFHMDRNVSADRGDFSRNIPFRSNNCRSIITWNFQNCCSGIYIFPCNPGYVWSQSLKGAKFLMNATMTSQEGVILVVGMVVAFTVSLVVIKF